MRSRCPPSGFRRLSSRRRFRAGRRPGSRWRPVPATRQRARWESAWWGRDRCRWCLAPRGSCSRLFASYVCDPQARLHVFCHAVPDTWHAMGVMLSAAGSLHWLRGVLGGSYERLLAAAERWPPGCEGLSFAPYLSGERTPYADPDIRGAFCGLDLRHDRGALCRSVLEGVAFGLRDSLELMRSLGVEPQVGPGFRRGRQQRAVAQDRRLCPSAAARADGELRRRRVRGSAARWHLGGRVRRRRGCCVALRARKRYGRAR